MALAVAALLAVTGCTTSEPPTDRRPSPGAAGTADRKPCQDTIAENCREITVAGRIHRYYLAAPEKGSSDAGLLIDVGGPGMSLSGVLPVDYPTSFRAELGATTAGKNLLLIEEPWVTGTFDPSCTASSGEFYAAARSDWRALGSAAAPRMQCPWGQGTYGWTRDTYREVLSAIMAKEGLKTLDMAAISFGAVRYSYIDDMVGNVTLVRPAAAPGTSNATILQARTEQLWKALAGRCSGCTTTDVRRNVDLVLRRYAGTSTELAGRSVPVTDFDVASAFVAAAISTAAEPSLHWRAGSGDVDQKAAAQLSDALWMRIGEQDVSPALVAYADEYCQAYAGAVVPDGTDPISGILTAPSLCSGRTASGHRPVRPVDCLVIGVNDTSAPGALAKTWTVDADGITVLAEGRRHWFTDVDRCAKGR
ncbi:hypothetical protein Ait01nite_070170 [Actinoplanes italicus]|uniref:Uncharacterized protein n=1 Tax=Actinoplanes italicus TaxID=113567 RepID=A0A2T0JV28_9ACTN|nr:hypothetical protein [Actinoplanes italicus]PRX11499.1 hypothetical protein CLV67_13175 [Actinoplanes italicus]GIE33972.1 hypothetical protein Ait01nite_070170 [Actinoplanes italicus]